MSFTKKDQRMHQLKVETGRKNIVDIYGKEHNGFSRRNFLSSGLVTLTAGFLPTPLIQLLARQAHAAGVLDCPKDQRDFPIFVNIQLNGGPALFAQHVAAGTNGRALTSYAKMALPVMPRRVGYFANKAPFWIDDHLAGQSPRPQSGMMLGLFKHLPRPNLGGVVDDPVTGIQMPASLADNINQDLHDNTSFVAVACESVDDSFNNPIDLSGVLSAAGITGNSLPHLLTGVGSFQGESLNTVPIVQGAGCILPPAPMTIVHTKGTALAEDFLKNSIKMTGSLESLTDPLALVNAINDLSSLQLGALANSPQSSESRSVLRRLMRCATDQNNKTIQIGGEYNIYSNSYPTNNTANGNARSSTAVKEIWMKNKSAADVTTQMVRLGLTADNMNVQMARIGTVVSACASGLGQACTINLGGYDYHQSFYSREDAHVKDIFYGDVIGRCLRTAKAFNKKMFIYVTADGSVQNSGQTPDADWTGEFFKRGMHYIFAYTPPALGSAPRTEGLTMADGNVDAPFQLNQFSESQNVVKTSNIVDSAHPIGNLASQDLCAAAVFLNYLNHAGHIDVIDKPALAKVKQKLVSAVPSQFTMDQFYTRIKAS